MTSRQPPRGGRRFDPDVDKWLVGDKPLGLLGRHASHFIPLVEVASVAMRINDLAIIYVDNTLQRILYWLNHVVVVEYWRTVVVMRNMDLQLACQRRLPGRPSDDGSCPDCGLPPAAASASGLGRDGGSNNGKVPRQLWHDKIIELGTWPRSQLAVWIPNSLPVMAGHATLRGQRVWLPKAALGGSDSDAQAGIEGSRPGSH